MTFLQTWRSRVPHDDIQVTAIDDRLNPELVDSQRGWLVRAVCSAGGMGMLGSAAMPPDVFQAAIRDIKAVEPASYGVTIIARFSAIEHIEVCVAEKVPVVVFFWDDPPDDWLARLRAAGSHIWFQVGSVA